MAKILIVDNCKTTIKILVEILEFENYKVFTTPSRDEFASLISENKYDLIILKSEMSGVEMLTKLRDQGIDTPVIMTIADTKDLKQELDIITDCMRYGATDFVIRPFVIATFLGRVRRSLCNDIVVKENKILKGQRRRWIPEIIGTSDKIMTIKQKINKVASTDAKVLITGENGTGKELVAKWLHTLSRRNDNPIVEVNCAAIPAELIESELFGHEKGSFTSANCRHVGKFEQANGGTLFLDEIGDMSLSSQAKVLRALQESKITRVGGMKDVPVNVRVIAATNKNLKSEIAKGNFREDLYHRLNVIPIHVPPLRERASDIPLLINQFIGDICNNSHIPKKVITDEVMLLLQKYEWPGNIRELYNTVERLVIMSDDMINRAVYEENFAC